MLIGEQQRLKELLDYDPETGKLTWKKRKFPPLANNEEMGKIHRWNLYWAGREAFTTVNDAGYRVGSILGKRTMAHRVIVKMVLGKHYPLVDHDNGDRQDNRWSNLRPLESTGENNRNTKKPKNNKSGVIGVTWHSTKRRWRASIGVNNKRIELGYFDDMDLAIAARRKAESEHGFHPNHGRR